MVCSVCLYFSIKESDYALFKFRRGSMADALYLQWAGVGQQLFFISEL